VTTSNFLGGGFKILPGIPAGLEGVDRVDLDFPLDFGTRLFGSKLRISLPLIRITLFSCFFSSSSALMDLSFAATPLRDFLFAASHLYKIKKPVD
jgi:hypothetical protein